MMKPKGKEMDNENDIAWLLSTRHDNGSDYWATPDKKIGIEKPISTLTALLLMNELELPKSPEALQGAANLALDSIQQDGRVKIAPKGSTYPCQSALVAIALLKNGYIDDPRVLSVLTSLRENRYTDGGWRCNKFFFGHGPETEHSNPGVTLFVLDAMRCANLHENTDEFDTAIETLLNHWTVRIPIGPCHFGMGTLFMQIEYPFLRYNLFYYVYVLSFYAKARSDVRFLEALDALRNKLDPQGRVVIERPSKKLQHLTICEKGKPSIQATRRYQEILANLEKSTPGILNQK